MPKSQDGQLIVMNAFLFLQMKWTFPLKALLEPHLLAKNSSMAFSKLQHHIALHVDVTWTWCVVGHMGLACRSHGSGV